VIWPGEAGAEDLSMFKVYGGVDLM